MCRLLSNQPIEFAIARRCLLRYPNSYRTVPPSAKPQGVIKAHRWGAWLWMLCPRMGERWGADRVCCGPVERLVSPSESSLVFCLLKLPARQIDRWIFRRVDRLKFGCRPVLIRVWSELKAHSGLRRIETLKSLRIMSDRTSVFDTAIAWILSLALESVHISDRGCVPLRSLVMKPWDRNGSPISI